MTFRNIIHKGIDYLFNQSGLIASVAMVLLTIVDISNLNDSKIDFGSIKSFPLGKLLYIIFVIVAIITAVISTLNQKEISALEKSNTQSTTKIVDLENALNDSVQSMNDLFNSYLMLIVKNLDFGSTERISVYKVFEEQFLLIGRASFNPTLTRIRRNSYPIDEGFIGEGWKDGEFFIDSLIDSTQPSSREAYYRDVMSKCTISKDILKNLNMKSCTYLVYRMDGYEGTPKAVIVVESTKVGGFTRETVIETLNEVKQPLVMFIEKNNGVKLQGNTLGL